MVDVISRSVRARSKQWQFAASVVVTLEDELGFECNGDGVPAEVTF